MGISYINFAPLNSNPSSAINTQPPNKFELKTPRSKSSWIGVKNQNPIRLNPNKPQTTFTTNLSPGSQQETPLHYYKHYLADVVKILVHNASLS